MWLEMISWETLYATISAIVMNLMDLTSSAATIPIPKLTSFGRRPVGVATLQAQLTSNLTFYLMVHIIFAFKLCGCKTLENY